MIRRVPSGTAPPRVVLSFDDGPVPGVTDRILDVLDAYGVRATFFVLGGRLGSERGREILARAAAEGHEIGNHSLTHRDLTRLPYREMVREVEATSLRIEETTGERPTLFRPPGGAWSQELSEAVSEAGIETAVLWDVDPMDWRGPDRKVLWDRVLESVRPGSIVLLHDNHGETAEALPVLLDALLGMGYEVGPVGEGLAR